MAQPRIQTRFIQANGLNFQIGTAGTGPRVLFITGSNGDLRKPNNPLHSLLVNKFTVLTYDQRGMGQSEKPEKDYSMQDYAEDAIAILDNLGWDQVMLAGFSFGGMVAQEVAIRWPERVSHLALMASTAGGAGGSSYPIQNFSKLAPYERARRGLEIADLSFTAEWQTKNAETAQAMIEKKVTAQALFSDEPGANEGTARQLAARATHDTFNRLHCITMPSLILAGDRDGQAPMESQKAMAERLPDCRFNIVSGSHGMLWEDEKTFASIASFFDHENQEPSAVQQQ